MLRGEPPLELRLLPQPIHRYASQEEGLVDGALFVFAQGTDPETMLLFEARKNGENYEWQYACARVTWAPVNVVYQSKEVWNVGYWDRVPNPTRPYVVFKNKRP